MRRSIEALLAVLIVIFGTGRAAALSQKVEWVNVGSSTGRFGFDWASAGVKGLNLAACPQGTRKDFAKMRAHRAEIADGAHVIIPLCPFTSVLRSDYDETHHGSEDHPLLAFDGVPDKQALEGFRDLLDGIWKGEFQIRDYAEPMSAANRKSYGEMVSLMKEVVAWCEAERLRPVFVMPPAAKTFDTLFPESFMKAYVLDFVRDVSGGKVPFFNFWKSLDFRDDALFANALFLNKTGRARFTAMVVDRLKNECLPFVVAEYLVVDLTGADKFPVMKVSEGNVANFNVDAYKTDKLVLRRIPAGSFLMGSPSDERGRESLPWLNKETRHKVTLSKDFYVGIFPVTQAQYAKIMCGAFPSHFKDNPDAPICPVESVSYKMIRGGSQGCSVPVRTEVDALSFLGVLRSRTGLAFDLPTEAQWEYACRAGTTGMTYFCESGVDVEGCYKANSWYAENSDGRTHGVGLFPANPWGLYDLFGNVWEICRDRVAPAPVDDLGSLDVVDPIRNVPNGNAVARGGAWLVDVANARAASRVGASDVSREFRTYGFRLFLPAGRTLSGEESND